MRLSQHPDSDFSVRRIEPDAITIGTQRLTSSFLAGPMGIHTFSPRKVEELELAHVAQILKLEPELVLLGTGKRLQFPSPAIRAAFLSKQIGLETMDLGAAVRTYNVLLQESRHLVLVALF